MGRPRDPPPGNVGRNVLRRGHAPPAARRGRRWHERGEGRSAAPPRRRGAARGGGLRLSQGSGGPAAAESARVLDCDARCRLHWRFADG